MRDFSTRRLTGMALLVFLASYVLVALHYAVVADVTHTPDTCTICSWAAAFVVTVIALPILVLGAVVTQLVGTRSILFRRTFAGFSSQPRAPPRLRANEGLLDGPA